MQYLLCSIGNERFAVDALQVQKIAKSTPVTRLPYVASYIDGLVNIDGDVIVQLDLRGLLKMGSPDGSKRNSGEIVVVNAGYFPVALLVDAALEKVEVEDDQVTRLGQGDLAGRETVQTDYLTAELSVDNERYLVFNIEAISALVRPEEAGDGERGFLSRNRQRAALQHDESTTCMTFSLGEELFALPLVMIQEVIELSSFRKLPEAPACVVGISSLRGQPILVLSLSSLFGLPVNYQPGQTCPVVMVPFGDGSIGLLVDRLNGVRNFTQAQMKKEESASSLVNAYIIDADQQITLLLDPDKLFSAQAFASLVPYIPKVKTVTVTREITTIKLLRVKLANELCAIPIDHVVRLLEYRNTTPIEGNEKGIVGTVDMDGRIIPLLNINKRLNVRNDENFEKLVVIEYGKREWALCVNEAQMLFDLDVSLIDECTHRQAVAGIASHNGQLVSILDFDWLISSAEDNVALTSAS